MSFTVDEVIRSWPWWWWVPVAGGSAIVGIIVISVIICCCCRSCSRKNRMVPEANGDKGNAADCQTEGVELKEFGNFRRKTNSAANGNLRCTVASWGSEFASDSSQDPPKDALYMNPQELNTPPPRPPKGREQQLEMHYQNLSHAPPCKA